MKRINLLGVFIAVTILVSSCNRHGAGELVGASKKGKYFEPVPFGMSYIPRGSFNTGQSDQDVGYSSTPTRTVTVEAFWMDETEITNNEYRQFVKWVQDSITRTMLGEQFEEYLISEDRDGNPVDPPRINWDEKIDLRDPDYRDAIEELYYSENDRLFGEKAIDIHKLNYEYFWVDYRQAAKRANSYNYKTQSYEGTVFNVEGEEVPIEGRSSFIMSKNVLVYPDTLCWIRDYTYSYNEPLATKYFWHPAFSEYPVVGVTWEQAKAFCIWRTRFKNEALASNKDFEVQDYRLPTETEWEYAARGGLRNSMYPWGGPYTRTEDGCFLANFKPLRGNYIDDNGMTSVPVATYDPNGYGLYDMSGNVAEWTITAYDAAGYNFMHDANPNYEYNALPDDPPAMKRKVIRGGSWKDIAYYLRVGTRTYEYQDTTKSYVGFRCVRASFGDEF
jgi:formylglycine-generating enzyme required for sulfatase activity